MNLDRRIANAVKRLHAKVDESAYFARMHFDNFVAGQRGEMHERFNRAARSIGQTRRWRGNVRSV